MSSLAVFRVTIEPLEDACIIRATGEVTAGTADCLRAQLDAARADRVTTLLDLSGVSFIESTGLRVLLEAARASDTHEWAWFLVRPSPAVMRLIELSGSKPRLPLVAPQPRVAQREAAVLPLRRREHARVGRAGSH